MSPEPRRGNALVYLCLILSGGTSLIYELLWTRIFSFSFGSTSLAFAAVLAVFFLGLAGGSLFGGRAAPRLRSPLMAYGWLELAIGAYAGLAFPFLFKLHHLFSLHNAGGAEPSGIAFRFAVAALVLAPPTLCMGATFPILLEHLRRQRSHLSESLGRLYGVNTLGAFLGVYLATHWLIPGLGLDKANYAAVALNTLVFAVVFFGARRSNPAAAAPGPLPPAAAQVSSEGTAASPRLATIGLLLLGASGFTTLIYEVVWGRVLTISLEGSLYGIGTTLGSFLAGIGIGGLVFSLCARRLQEPTRLFRAYVLVCLAVIAYLALSRFLLPIEGYLIRSITQHMRGLLGLHAGFALGVLFLLPVTAGLGFMFPAAVALYNHGRPDPAKGAGTAYAFNTAMSVVGSLLSATYLMDKIGIEGIVFLGILVMLGTLLASVLLAEAGKPDRLKWLALVVAPLILASGWWPAIDARTVLISSFDGSPPSLSGLFRTLSAQFAEKNPIRLYKDGVGTTLTVTLAGRSVGLQSNGLAQSGRDMDPPHYNLESSLVGLFPAMHKPEAKNALVIGLGAGISVGVLRMAGIPQVEVVELEPSMADICRAVYPKGQSPLDDTGVTLRLDDARNFLVRNGYRETPMHWDLIASQPAHPWVSGAADLFTEEMFRLAYASLAEGGVFCQWFMANGIDSDTYTALANAFGSVFDQVMVYRTYGALSGLYFIGTKGNASLSLAAANELFQRPGLRQLLDLHGHRRPVDIFKYAATGFLPGKAMVRRGGPVNRDRNAFVEARMPLLPRSAGLPAGGPGDTSFPGPLPIGFRDQGPAETLFVLAAIDEGSGNLPSPRPSIEIDSLRIARLERFQANAPEPIRTYHGIHLALARRSMGPKGLDSAVERARLNGNRLLEAQLRLLRLRMHPMPFAKEQPGPHLPDSLPETFLREYRTSLVLSAAEAAHASRGHRIPNGPDRPEFPDETLAGGPVDVQTLRMVRLLESHRAGDTSLASLDEPAFQAMYRKILIEWSHKPCWLEALAWYCKATNRAAMAFMVENAQDYQREQAISRLMSESLAHKKSKRHQAALESFRRVHVLNPAFQGAYLGRAEIYGLEKDPGAYAEMVVEIEKVFPRSEILLQRTREAFNLNPDAPPTLETPPN